jgi:hypothetical protein
MLEEAKQGGASMLGQELWNALRTPKEAGQSI